MNQSNLPNINLNDSNSKLFNRQFNNNIGYIPSEVDAVIGYFLKRGFEKVSAVNTALVILEQASIDKIKVSELLDTLTGLSEVQLSNVIAQILNVSRPKSSRIGYKVNPIPDLFEERNIIFPVRSTEPESASTIESEYLRPGYVAPGYVK